MYALTHKSWRVRRQLKTGWKRFAAAEIDRFLRAFKQVEGKMSAFAGDINALSNNVGFVRKNREQVVIGLMKTGARSRRRWRPTERASAPRIKRPTQP